MLNKKRLEKFFTKKANDKKCLCVALKSLATGYCTKN